MVSSLPSDRRLTLADNTGQESRTGDKSAHGHGPILTRLEQNAYTLYQTKTPFHLIGMVCWNGMLERYRYGMVEWLRGSFSYRGRIDLSSAPPSNLKRGRIGRTAIS